MDEDFILDAELIEVVMVEAQENLEAALRALREEATTLATVDALFRCFHSIKGNSAMAQRTDIASSAHSLESCLERVRESKRPLASEEVVLLIEICDLLNALILNEGNALPQLTRRIESFEKDLRQVPPHEEAPSSSDTGELRRDDTPRAGKNDETKLKVSAETVMATVEVAGELFQIDERLKHFVTTTLSSRVARGIDTRELDELNEIAREFDGWIEKLYELLLDLQRLPVAQIVAPLERSLRDASRKTGKEVRLVVSGGDLRIDKQVLQTLRDPLMHMVRNSVDHGIESPDKRASLGKGREGTISLCVEELDDLVVVTVEDDGAGIQLDKVKARAVARGLIDEDAVSKLSEQELIEFIFNPGFSTTDQVSELSGRGVGMDVVLQQIRGAGGAVYSSTTAGRGTRFRLEIPKASSPVTDGLAVVTGTNVHLLSLKNVHTFVGRSAMELILLPTARVLAKVGEAVYPVFRAPGSPRGETLGRARTIGVIVEGSDGSKALIPVDGVLGRCKALIQTIHKDAGATNTARVCILGDGTIAFAMEIDSLLRDPKMMWKVEDATELGDDSLPQSQLQRAS